MDFGIELKKVMEAKGLGNKELGELADIGRHTISKYLSSIITPSRSSLARLNTALGTNFDYEELDRSVGQTKICGVCAKKKRLKCFAVLGKRKGYKPICTACRDSFYKTNYKAPAGSGHARAKIVKAKCMKCQNIFEGTFKYGICEDCKNSDTYKNNYVDEYNLGY